MSQFEVGDFVIITHEPSKTIVFGKVLSLESPHYNPGIVIDTLLKQDPRNQDHINPGEWPTGPSWGFVVERIGPDVPV